MSKEELKFSGYEPRPVMSAKLQELLDIVKQLQIDVEKLKLGSPAKASKSKAEE